MVEIGDNSIPRIPRHVDHLCLLFHNLSIICMDIRREMIWHLAWEHFKGQVGLDDSRALLLFHHHQ